MVSLGMQHIMWTSLGVSGGQCLSDSRSGNWFLRSLCDGTMLHNATKWLMQ
jgi:hypothetical protein